MSHDPSDNGLMDASALLTKGRGRTSLAPFDVSSDSLLAAFGVMERGKGREKRGLSSNVFVLLHFIHYWAIVCFPFFNEFSDSFCSSFSLSFFSFILFNSFEFTSFEICIFFFLLSELPLYSIYSFLL